jgi:hypothetical protein
VLSFLWYRDCSIILGFECKRHSEEVKRKKPMAILITIMLVLGVSILAYAQNLDTRGFEEMQRKIQRREKRVLGGEERTEETISPFTILCCL